MATVCYQLDTRREKKDGTYPIKLYIRHKSRILISTDFALLRERGRVQSITKKRKATKLKMWRYAIL